MEKPEALPEDRSENVPPPADDALTVREPVPLVADDPIVEQRGPSLDVADDPDWSTLAAIALREAAVEAAAEPEPWREAAPTGAPAPALEPFQEAAVAEAPAPRVFHETAGPDAPGVPVGAIRSPWPADEPSGPSDRAVNSSGDGADAPLPGPTHADWRQLSDEVRRLAAQIAHGRA